MNTMRVCDRMLAVVQHREHDRVPFVQLSNLFNTDQEVWELFGREKVGLLYWTPIYQFETPHCHVETENIIRNGKKALHRTLFTPEGAIHEERLWEPTYGTTSVAEHYIKEPDEYRILMAYFRDIIVRDNIPLFRENHHALQDMGLPHAVVPPSPYQQLWIQWVGIEELVPHMVEYPDLMAEVIALMSDVQRRVFDVACKAVREAPVPYIVFSDNITAPMVGETYFRRYCMPAYRELAEMLDETGKDVPVFVHMDGYLSALWDAIGESRVRGLDSMSPPPDNDTPVSEAVARWPEMRLFVNFPSSMHLESPETIYSTALEILEQGGRQGRLQLQISENVPPGVWQRSYPHIMRAIEDFGPACG